MKKGELPEQTLLREVKEEAGVDVKITRKLGELYNEFDHRTHIFYLTEIIGGVIKLGGPEANRQTKRNKYMLEWHPLKEIGRLTLYPKGGQEIIKENI